VDEKLRRLVDAYQIVDTDSALAWEKAFSVRSDLLQPGFGAWDSCDPVAHAILDVVEAQTELADAIMDFAECRGSEAAGEAAIQAAQENRRAAVKRLARMLAK
jgi:hypothetical protein